MKTKDDLIAFAESKEDAQESIYSGELFLLHKIAEASSDLQRARGIPSFAEAVGGIDVCENALKEATDAWESYMMEFESNRSPDPA